MRRFRFSASALVAVGLLVAVRGGRAQEARPVRTRSGNGHEIHSVAFSPDGKTLASADAYPSSDPKPGVIQFWDPGRGALQRVLERHTGWVRSVGFTSDGKTLASGGNDQTVKPWDVATRRLRMTLNGHSDGVASLAIAPGGETLASNGFDKSVRLWDLGSGKELRRLESPDVGYGMALSPDGSLLAAAESDGLVRVWDLATEKPRVAPPRAPPRSARRSRPMENSSPRAKARPSRSTSSSGTHPTPARSNRRPAAPPSNGPATLRLRASPIKPREILSIFAAISRLVWHY